MLDDGRDDVFVHEAGDACWILGIDTGLPVGAPRRSGNPSGPQTRSGPWSEC